MILLDDDEEKEIQNEQKQYGLILYSFNDILAKGLNQEVKFEHAKPETICTICYTSGTTGIPKGAMVSHKALLSEIDMMLRIQR